MPERCQAIAKHGRPCQARTLPGRPWCLFHDPEAEGERQEISRKGGCSRSNQARARKSIPEAMTADELAGWLSVLFHRVIAGDAEPRVAQAAATIARVLLDARAAGELEARLAELEARAGMSDQRWSA